MNKSGIENLKFPLKEKWVVMLAPSFIVDFKYPNIIQDLTNLGFDKVVEITFGAKLVNKEYHKILSKNKKGKNELKIASVCPGIQQLIKNKYKELEKNLIQIDSPMIAMAKICKKIYPKHKKLFISPCDFKKLEANSSKEIDYIIDFKELEILIKDFKNKYPNIKLKEKTKFDKFYNDYTKIYPLAGGLSKTAKFHHLLTKKEYIIIDGFKEVEKILKNINQKKYKQLKFLDINFCKGGCIGGPCINSKSPLFIKKNKILKYRKQSLKENISKNKKGLLKKSEGISFKRKY